ncbi:MAG: hypothetical protein GXP35_06810 [Actinobacteria bacterium]|nr:hypothetical protein [Actinomycetota bacterium]
MKRVSFVGSSGAGKTTLAMAVAARIGVEHIELDGIFHQADWTQLPADEFVEQITARTNDAVKRTGGWTADGNYNTQTAGLVQRLADTIVWIDTSKPRVMYRVIKRTLRRAILREELWNGNREPWTNLYAWDPAKNIIRWAWTTHASTKARYETMSSDGSWDHAEVVRLTTPTEVAAWLAALGGPNPP